MIIITPDESPDEAFRVYEILQREGRERVATSTLLYGIHILVLCDTCLVFIKIILTKGIELEATKNKKKFNFFQIVTETK